MAYKRNSSNQDFKKSGAVYTVMQKGNYKGKTIVNAWNVSKSRGMIKATVYPYHGTKLYTPTTGKQKQTMMCDVFYVNSGVTVREPVSMDVKTKVIVIPKLGMCISPNGSGTTKGGKRVSGYFGKFTRN